MAHAGASDHWERLWASGLAKGDKFDVGGPSATLLGALRRLDPVSEGATALREIEASGHPRAASVEVCCGDFFRHTGAYDLVWDCTFLCALDPSAAAESGDFSAAIEHFRTAIAATPTAARPRDLLAQCLLEVGDDAGACDAAACAVALAPAWAAARLTLGRASLNAGRYADAVSHFRVALEPREQGVAAALRLAASDDDTLGGRCRSMSTGTSV
ncbi:hypothetical protein EMIHUDRAFT_239551 [Emiliania huxleyi CCMP1516]|uniref:Tetratricopeptide repeat protein n=2 Tax=Emiliania huxleyi TaxID=2903 RepID=A0A0D3JIY6_EMIH1|nr:hypothetical protein EMIHUDRAFT_239551 [Emiliania huxleyi CCMP1516]EOD23471.1 hypothetical protein EMIHUDRAFT_239551 [Emiliania huxleyi CCMP1516]|eukprot:XP_005775900.1 hypothetical protein EMIHUDRAFT_239551 [Emiliania huxleyi CCMP1516]